MGESAIRDVAQTYNQMAKDLDSIVAKVPFLVNSYLLYNKLIPKLTKRGRFKRVLDAGCGSGLQTVQLAKWSEEVIGLDIAAGLIELARKRCMGYQKVSFVTESITKMPFEDESFDAVFSYGDVVSHIQEDYEKAISELARVAKPGGLVSFEVDNKWNFNLLYHPLELWDAMTHWGRGHDSRKWNGMFFKTFTHPELHKILRKYGLNPVEFHGHNIFASLVPDRFALEEGKRTLMGELALWLGKLDQPLSGIYPFYRLGYNIVAVTLKA